MKKLPLKRLLAVQRAAIYDKNSLNFAIANLLTDLHSQSNSKIQLGQFDYAKGGQTAAKLEKIAYLQALDSKLIWHKKPLQKAWCQLRLKWLRNELISPQAAINCCGNFYWKYCNSNMLRFANLLKDEAVDEEAYASKYNCATIKAQDIFWLRRRSFYRQECLQEMIELFGSMKPAAKCELRRWIMQSERDPKPGETAYISVGNASQLQDAIDYHNLIVGKIIRFDIKQRLSKEYSISELMDWWCYLYWHRQWGAKQFDLDVNALALAVLE